MNTPMQNYLILVCSEVNRLKPKYQADKITLAEVANDVAHEFAKVLREWLSAEEMEKVIARNNHEKDSHVCHSHDFCDANMAMEEGIKNLGITSRFDGDAFHEEFCQLWSYAWDLAVRNKFAMGGE